MRVCDGLGLAKEFGSYFAYCLMSFHLGKNREWIFLHFNDSLERQSEFITLLDRYRDGEPLEYITRRCEFMGREFEVGSGVLIPRVESEILVQKALDVAKKFDSISIAEIGVGSGIISISLALELKNAKIVASDISPKALEFARINRDKFGANVELVNTNYLDGIDGDFDIIISNPPYIAKDYPLDKWVLNEPKTALIGGKVGDEILKDIAKIAKSKAKYLICEMGYDQRESMKNYLDMLGFESEFYRDLAGLDRGFVAYNKGK
ncbi:MAG: peptide chain release factor N(5)-glutamine methyltransferase [Campylobacter lanienae]|uniref:peptide chain release factor N(5)-glutamine methyltransferase n=1 Tax=Campylobacter lanienae TaxID=75658 RepID=UPI00242F940F|nr:peptide chain release factor N(5)-glutamine methyltransferase [Campylobacter lanienae]MCI7363914.1 peptide chain release factor N(5)-glutamine methyltransferase [Campylobacter lanienae]